LTLEFIGFLPVFTTGDTGIHFWKINGNKRRIEFSNGGTHLNERSIQPGSSFFIGKSALVTTEQLLKTTLFLKNFHGSSNGQAPFPMIEYNYQR